MKKTPIIAVVGPTASGKSELAVSLAEKLDGEVISFDSMQIYKGMHIASAAPNHEEMRGIPHHLVEFLEPSESFSVAEFLKLAKAKTEEITKRGKRVIIAGGTGLYINSFLDNIIFTQSETDQSMREELNREFDRVGAEEMLRRLKEFDPETANRLHPNNKKRIIRAFEIYETTGQTMTEQLESSRAEESPYEPYMIGLTYFDRECLYDRINLRVDKMLEKGLLDEAKGAFKGEGSKTSVQAIGHKELFGYIKGECSLSEAVELLKMQTRRYAKRQLTWFKRDERISWIYRDIVSNTTEEAIKILEGKGYFE
ncbi:MAG: tRNA (adenosine(37)-N6)-dimethylallyltransferase MiaA [Clostridia bacterium]|nr:tRNA (adenosine(37)-N6)-dimethylallyltransferase MiaA [Clostridia bacterium]